MKAISLFSGCGGDTLGMENAGFKVVAFSEFNKKSIESHIANFPDSVLLKDGNVTDITKLKDSVFEPYSGQIDLLFSGFPCQGFSTAGKKKSTDPRNQLFNQFVRVVRITQPKFIIGENVTGLLSMKSGPKEDDPFMIRLIEKEFADIGYTIFWRVQEAVAYGVPQNRKRLILVGYKTIPLDPEPFWAKVAEFGAAKVRPRMIDFVQKSLEGAFELVDAAVPPGFENVALNLEGSVYVTGTPHPYVVLKATSFNVTYNEKTYERLLSCGKRDSPVHSEILDLKVPCKTIICTYDHQPRLLVGLIANGKKYVRCLLPDELKMIQGFHESFKVCGSVKDSVVQIGNAVPPPLIECVALTLKSYLVPEPVVPKKQAPRRQKAKVAPQESPHT